MKLNDLFTKYGTDKGDGEYGHSLGDVYEPYLKKFFNPKLIEIGVQEGKSLKAWREFFGPAARIVGIDINPVKIDEAIVEVGKQDDINFLFCVIRDHGVPDIVVDDASRNLSDQIFSFIFFISKMKPGSIYIVEDVHCDNLGKILELGLTCCNMLEVHHYTKQFNRDWFTCVFQKVKLPK